MVRSGRHRKGHHNQYSFGHVSRLGLREIAQRSAQRAHNAVVDQHIAAQKASFIAKSVLAEAAFQAAETAEVALATKHALLQSLEKQVAQARHALEAEIRQLQLAKHTAIAAKETAQRAAKHVQIVAKALKQAQRLALQAASAADHARIELALQKKMVRMAHARLAAIESKLHQVQAEFEKTKKAANKASAAAHAAYRNAFQSKEQKEKEAFLKAVSNALHIDHAVQEISAHKKGFSAGGGHDAIAEEQIVKLGGEYRR